MAAIPSVLKLVNDESSDFPSAQTCNLILPSGSADMQAIMDAIQQNISSGECSVGVYVLEEGVFLAQDGDVLIFRP